MSVFRNIFLQTVTLHFDIMKEYTLLMLFLLCSEQHEHFRLIFFVSMRDITYCLFTLQSLFSSQNSLKCFVCSHYLLSLHTSFCSYRVVSVFFPSQAFQQLIYNFLQQVPSTFFFFHFSHYVSFLALRAFFICI